jgi:hypothetical protein
LATQAAGGERGEDIGVKQKRLNEIGVLALEQFGQLRDTLPELDGAAETEKVERKIRSGELLDEPIARGGRGRKQRVHGGFETASGESDCEPREALFRAAHRELGRDQRDPQVAIVPGAGFDHDASYGGNRRV